jgi:uncharacterized membrane protein YphA (DoxX/SURF4 family)
MKKMIKRNTIIEIILVLNIILFLYTGISKIMDYSEFKEQLADSPMLGFASTPVAILLPWLEFAVALMLIIPKWRLKGLYATLGLMILFTAYIIGLFSVNKELPCSCGGIIALLSWKQHIIFNSVFILLNALAIRLQKREKKEQAKAWSNMNTYLASHS